MASVVVSEPPPRICVIAPGGAAARGGIGRMVAHLVGRMAADPHIAVDVIDSYGPAVNERAAKYRMPFYFAKAVARVALACAARRIQLAHVHMAANGSVYRKSLLIAICLLFRVPVILHIHGGDLDKFCRRLGPTRLRMLRLLLGGVSEILVLGEYWRQLAVTALAVPEARVTVLHNAVPRPLAHAGRTEGTECRLLFLGMVTREKGMGELLAALALPGLAELGWRMTIAGIGDIDRYREEARALGLIERVRFVGWTDDEATRALLSSADILVLPSHFECFPMAIIEAMSHGVAVVATPVGSVPEAIAHGDTGLLIPVGDPDRLADAIRMLVVDPGLRRRLGENARARFRSNFDLDVYERRLREIYRAHLAAR